MAITDYEPKLLWGRFDEIRQIPRCSGDEERVRNYVMELATNKGWEVNSDSIGNVVIRVPASPGHENAATVALQGHLDMVCEKNSNVEFDFAKDAIRLEISDDWLTAEGTTLGSDNGVGVAAALAVAEDESLVHGPLELLFTIDEETGLTGAAKLEPGFLKAKVLLNLDSEELGSVFIGCAGGGDSKITLPIEWADAPSGATAVELTVGGLRGGHSGLDIVEQRGNAIKIIARILWQATRQIPIRLANISGGNKHNAIPREAFATVFVPTDESEGFSELVEKLRPVISDELGGREQGLMAEIKTVAAAPARAFDEMSHKKTLDLIMSIPHGVDAMNYDIEGLVETSNNLATLSTGDGSLVITTSSRSSINSALQSMRDRIRAAGELAGARVEEEEPYPGWKPNVESELLKLTQRVHQDLFGEVPEAKAIHAGLECGIIGEKFPGMDMISFGPHIEHPHSPDERINIPSVEKFWKLLTGVVEALA